MKQGKKAIVVGASSGIGLEVAKCLMLQGWKVGVAARRVELLQDLGAAAIERIDVTADDATEGLQRMITKLGGMDCTVIFGHESHAERVSPGSGTAGIYA